MPTEPIKSKYQFNPAKPPWSALKSTLNNGTALKKGGAEYQTINGLIKASEDFQSVISEQLTSIFAALNNQDTLPANSLLGRGSKGNGPVQNIFLGEGLEMQENVLTLTNIGDWDLVITKQSDQDIINSTVLTNDTELWFNTFQFQVWHVQLLLVYGGTAAAGDYKLDFILPTVSGWYTYIGQSDLAGALLLSTGLQFGAGVALNANLGLGTDSLLTPRVFKLEMMVRCALDGSIQMQFANQVAAVTTASRTYSGSVLRAKLLAGVPIGGTDSGGGGGEPGGGADPPTVPFPNDLGTVEAYFAANPAQVANSCQAEMGGSGNWDLMNGVVAALQAISPRYGFNGKRGDINTPSVDVVNYYHGVMPPTLGSRNVYTIDIIRDHCGANPTAQWSNITTPAAQAAWMPGPI